ncbi:hypothetical protein EGK76_15140 [Luteimonas sp. 100069]|nr:hypothetical protein EGK76_15140 [Luteimonas sp. 100069]
MIENCKHCQEQRPATEHLPWYAAFLFFPDDGSDALALHCKDCLRRRTSAVGLCWVIALAAICIVLVVFL